MKNIKTYEVTGMYFGGMEFHVKYEEGSEKFDRYIEMKCAKIYKNKKGKIVVVFEEDK